jgi:hypothetical protein
MDDFTREGVIVLSVDVVHDKTTSKEEKDSPGHDTGSEDVAKNEEDTKYDPVDKG